MENTAIRIVGPKLTIQLTCQAPMIHFQHYEKGATLRASEVKPKLDKYIINKMGWVEAVPAKFLIKNQSKALNYKMTIVDRKSSWYSVDDFILFYGNTDRKVKKKDEHGKPKSPEKLIRDREVEQKDKQNQKHLIATNPVVTITCFNEELLTIIKESVEGFFLIMNFGTMQGKGFGSFLVAGTEQGSRDAFYQKFYEEVQRVYPDTSNLFVMNLEDQLQEIDDQWKKYETIFSKIKNFYQLTKSGINRPYRKGYVAKYMLSKGYGNEKAYLKQSRVIEPFMTVFEKSGRTTKKYIKDIDASTLSPRDLKKYEKGPQVTTDSYRYTRGLLGLSSQFSFINLDERKILFSEREKDRFDEEGTVLIENDNINRFSSPIQFKIIGNEVLIFLKTIPDEIYGKKFRFTNKADETKSVDVFTPSKEEFDINDFLGHAVDYYNNYDKNVTITTYRRQEGKHDK